jgi:hypothetical protein
MKTIHSYFIILLAAIAFLGCEKDNYNAPSSILSGKVTYNDAPIGLRSNGVQLELWQYGYGLFSKIPVYVTQDGTFSAQLFDGDYKLVLLNGNGPWVSSSDSIDVKVSGATTVNVPVTPYFIITQSSITHPTDSTVTATVSIQQVDTSLPLEAVNLYVGTTSVVDAVRNVASAQIPASAITDITQPIALSLVLPTERRGDSLLFSRIGVKTTGVAEQIYTPPAQTK